MTGVWLFIAFTTGVTVGATWRESYDLLIGRDDPMSLLNRVRNVRIPALTLALFAAVLLNVFVGVAVIVNQRADDREAACLVEFNRITAEARESRTAVSDATGTAQLDYVIDDLAYQRGLLKTVTSDAVTVDDLATVIRRRIDSATEYRDRLTDQEKVRAVSPYPPADFCAVR